MGGGSDMKRSSIREWGRSIGGAVFIALFLRSFVVEAYRIPSGSMFPTLEIGDYIFVNKFIYGLRLPLTNLKVADEIRPPRFGEVIVFQHPKEPDKDLIKRVIGVPGDTVELRDDQLYVNGRPVARRHLTGDCRYEDYEEEADRWQARSCEAYLETLDGARFTTYVDGGDRHAHSFGPITVPAHSVFVLGDNRDNSSDSRYWGFVPFDHIKGRAMVVWWASNAEEGLKTGRIFHAIR
jgi:signal peptidase I